MKDNKKGNGKEKRINSPRKKLKMQPNISAPPALVQKSPCKEKNPLPSPYKDGKKKILNPEVYFDDDDGNIGDHSAIDSPGPIAVTSKQSKLHSTPKHKFYSDRNRECRCESLFLEIKKQFLEIQKQISTLQVIT